MKKQRRFFFNMVEIALAMAIIGIGLSSVLVLFPVGINAGKSSIADNNIADVSEYMLGYLRAGMMSEWIAQKDDPSKNFFSSTIPSTMPTEADVNGATFNPIGDNNWIGSNKPGVFKFEQASGTGTDRVVDFAACVRVWSSITLDNFWALTDITNLRNDYPKGVSRAMYTQIASTAALIPSGANYMRVFFVEISWPLEAPLDRREKRTYRMEIYNESYTPIP